MREVTITEYAHENKISVSAVYKRISRGKLKTTQGVRNNQNCTLILVDYDGQANGHIYTSPPPKLDKMNENVQQGKEPIQDAEIISDSPAYQMVSMEHTTFEQLIQRITDLAEARSSAERTSLERIEKEYLELKAENKELKEKLEIFKIESIQAQSDLKISEIRIKELENELQEHKETFWYNLNKQWKL